MVGDIDDETTRCQLGRITRRLIHAVEIGVAADKPRPVETNYRIRTGNCDHPATVDALTR